MAKHKKSEREYLVPMTLTVTAVFLVRAVSAEEASKKANDAEYEECQHEETTDWEQTGPPVLNV